MYPIAMLQEGVIMHPLAMLQEGIVMHPCGFWHNHRFCHCHGSGTIMDNYDNVSRVLPTDHTASITHRQLSILCYQLHLVKGILQVVCSFTHMYYFIGTCTHP